MSGYEWETRRIPRATGHGGLGLSRARTGPIAEFVALEFPRETVTWVLNASSSDARERSRSSEARMAAKSRSHRSAKT